MRFTRTNQLWLTPSSGEIEQQRNPLIQELAKMSTILDSCPAMAEVYDRVKKDLLGDRREDCGATGLSAEQALRAALAKEKLGLSYRELEFSLVDSLSVRSFVRLEPNKRASKSVLNRDIRLISQETWELFNNNLKKYAQKQHIEDGSCVRGDTTATETNIHHPTDARLLCDCVRVLTRLLCQANEQLPGLNLSFGNHTRRAKKRLYKINNAKNEEQRRKPYRDLLRVTEWTKQYAQTALEQLQRYETWGLLAEPLTGAFIQEISHYLRLTEQVIVQTIRRVLNGEQVCAVEKVVSIFEPHTDIIEKGGRDTIFGHKVCLTSGKSGLILDCVILEGNPPDSSLVDTLLSRHERSYGRVPEQIAFDGGFASKQNAHAARDHGVKDVVFAKTRDFEAAAFVTSKKVFKALTNFRAGIEAGISALKRSWGFARVFARGLKAFTNSLLNAVAAFNLTLIARHQLQRE